MNKLPDYLLYKIYSFIDGVELRNFLILDKNNEKCLKKEYKTRKNIYFLKKYFTKEILETFNISSIKNESILNFMSEKKIILEKLDIYDLKDEQIVFGIDIIRRPFVLFKIDIINSTETIYNMVFKNFGEWFHADEYDKYFGNLQNIYGKKLNINYLRYLLKG